MKHHVRVLILFGALVAVLTAANVAVASAAGAGKGNSHRDEVIAYWTPDRIANAKPREVTPAGVPGAINPQKPGNGGGGSGGGGGKPGGGGNGGGSRAVTGAPWTGGGLVQKTTGKVLFTLPDGDYVCSGSVVTDGSATLSLVLTAGHCVYDEVNHVFATNWMFMPAFEDAPSTYNGSFDCTILTYGCWVANSLVTTTAWANGGGSLAGFNDDYAFAVMGAGGHGAYAGQLDAAVGAQEIGFDLGQQSSVYAFGYPHASPYDGSDLIYCSGSPVVDGWGGTSDYGLKCAQTGGSSGGPWFANFDSATGTGQLNSVNSFKYTYGKYSSYMFGPYFDAYTEATYIAAEGATGNTLVVAP